MSFSAENNKLDSMLVHKATPEYLQDLLKDKKQLQNFPNIFLHLEIILEKGRFAKFYFLPIDDYRYSAFPARQEVKYFPLTCWKYYLAFDSNALWQTNQNVVQFK